MLLEFRHLAFGFAVGASVGAGGAYLYVNRPGIRQPIVAPNVVGSEGGAALNHPALKFGVPQTDTLRFFTGFVSCFDQRTRNPKWVLEYITKDSVHGEGNRSRSDFVEDKALESRFRSRIDDYYDSGYDRGHMAPAANHKGSQKAMDETFVLSNISPQHGPGFNRDYWARFEKFVKDVAKRADGVYILTGPLFLPNKDSFSGKWMMQHPMIGDPPRLVSVPTHFYKVVLAENASGEHGSHSASVGAFVMPNAPIDPKTPLSAFVVPLDALESAAGTKFFPGYVNDSRRAALDDAALGWQELGQQQMKLFDRKSLADDQARLMPERAQGPLLLTANANQQAAASTSGRRNKAAATATAPVLTPGAATPKTVGGNGAVHLCEHVACRLPAENWWQDGAAGSQRLQRQPSRKGSSKSAG